ncbi:tandem-95 repeat protein [Neptuniibacter sp. QD37_6]|uniref:tandem-95 repeat protein n=1 Tax=Neptuniibacter sp. QD37_6 TaxID=3398210 RepID=UPI0039F5DC22
MSRPKINSRSTNACRLMQLEQRLMFDGAAADTTVEAVTEFTEADTAEIEGLGVFTLAVAYEKGRIAADKAQQQIKAYIEQAEIEELFSLFNGGKEQIDAEWLQSMESVRQLIVNDQISIRVEFVSDEFLGGALGAFSAEGSEGEAIIFINQSYLENNGTDAAAKILIEEFGHAIDSLVNGGIDTVGDEGQQFALFVTGTSSEQISDLAAHENDSGTIEINGETVEVEWAQYDFVNAYSMLRDLDGDGAIDNTENWAEKEQESHTIIMDGGGLGPVTVDDDTGSHLFSGNDVSAIGINIGGETYYGWISRPIKTQGQVRAFYFWTDASFVDLATAQADGNQDGDSDVTDNIGFVLVVDQAYFNGLSTSPVTVSSGAEAGTYNVADVGSSSDRVDSALNALVLAANSGPVAVADSQSVPEDTIASGNVLTNDTDADGDSLSVTSFAINGQLFSAGSTVSLPDIGTLKINSDGSYTFNPVSGYNGAVPVATYIASDGEDTSVATLSITVTAVNEAPIAQNDTGTVTEDTQFTGNLINSVSSSEEDTDADNDALTVTGFSFTPAGGSLINGTVNTETVMPGVGAITIYEDGSYSFTPSPDYTGSVPVITYTISDGNGGSDTATLSLTIQATADEPLAGNDSATAVEAGGDNNGTVGANATGNVLSNDSAQSSGTLTVVSIGQAIADKSVATGTTSADGTSITGEYGVLTLGADGSYSYVVNDNHPDVQALRVTGQTLTDNFVYEVSESGSGSVTETLSITIDGRNDNPEAQDDTAIARETTTVSPVVTGYDATGNVLVNDTDVDGSANGETATISGLRGSVDITSYTTSTPTATLRFVGDSGFTSVGTGKELYYFDGSTYWAVYDSSNNQVYVTSNTLVDSGTDTYDLGLSGDPVKYAADATPTTYTSIAGLSFFDGKTVGFEESSSAEENAASMKTATVASATSAASSTVTVNAPTAAGTISVGMTVSGTGVPVGTIITDITYSAGVISTLTLDQTITSSNGDTLNFSGSAGSTYQGQHGSLILNVDGSYTYTPTADNAFLNEGDLAVEEFTYTMTDTAGAISTATLSITVLGSGGSEPVAADDTDTVTEDSGSNAAGDLLANDTFDTSEGSVYQISSSTETDSIVDGSGNYTVAGLYGTLTVNAATGAYTYVPDNSNPAVDALHDGDSLTDSFSYILTDSAGNTYVGKDDAALTITIQGKNDTPTGGKLSDGSNDPTYDAGDARYEITTPEDTPIGGQVRAYDSDDSNLTYSSGSTAPANGSVSINADGTYTYTPDAHYTGSDSFTITVTDPQGATTEITVQVTVTPVNDAPILDLDGSSAGLNYAASYTLDGSAVAVADSDNLISDIDDTHIESATITLTNPQAGDLLSVGSLPSGITVSASTSSSITLTGSALKSDYQAALNAITFSTSGSDRTDRTISVTVNDGDDDSNTALATVSINLPPLTVTGVTVNEASPYSVFQVSGTSGQQVSLQLEATGYTTGDATLGMDTGNAGTAVPLQYFDGSNWVDYTPGSNVTLSGSTLLVRTAVTQDTLYEGLETFTLKATDDAGATYSGQGGIIDDGTGAVFSASNTSFVADSVSSSTLDDDREISVNSIEVNEGSPYAVFTVSGAANQYASLALSNGTAAIDVDGSPLTDGSEDFGPSIEYSADNGANWTTYTSGFVQLNGSGSLLVRTSIINDNVRENSENFSLSATNTGGSTGSGNGFILDDGAGTIFNPDGSENTSAEKSDDRSITVTSFGPVNEASTYAMFKVDSDPGSILDLSLVNGSASLSGETIEFSYDGTTWVTYSVASKPTVPAGGSFFVRNTISSEVDTVYEGAETFSLQVSFVAAPIASATGQTSIVDDGTGSLFDGTVTGGNPNSDSGELDDDRPELLPEDTNPAEPVTIIVAPAVTENDPADQPDLDVVELAISGGEDLTYDAPKGELILQRDIPEQQFIAGDGFSSITFTIPADTFGHTSPGAEIELSALLADGRKIPSWLLFDPEKGEFRGIPPKGFDEVLLVRVVARDQNGAQVETVITIDIRAQTTAQIEQQGRSSFINQLKGQEQFSWKSERDALLKQVVKLRT